MVLINPYKMDLYGVEASHIQPRKGNSRVSHYKGNGPGHASSTCVMLENLLHLPELQFPE